MSDLLHLLNTLSLHTAKVDQVKFDVMELHARPELAAQQRMVDDASGDVKVSIQTNPQSRCTADFSVNGPDDNDFRFLQTFLSSSGLAH